VRYESACGAHRSAVAAIRARKTKGRPESRPSLRKKPRASGGLGGGAKVQSHTKRPPSRRRGGPFVLAPSRQPVMLQKETANRPARNPPRGTKERAHRAGRKRAGTLDTDGALNVPLRQKEGGLKPPRHQDPGNIHQCTPMTRIVIYCGRSDCGINRV
jgi:hypothetical protein